MVSIETPRLLLREFTVDDFEMVHRYAVNPNVVMYMNWGPNSETETRRFLQNAIKNQIVKPRTSYELAITLDGELIGGCGFTIQNLKLGESEIGYCIDEPHWGKGYGTEVAGALIQYGFKERGMHRIFAKCDPENKGSYRVMEKNGMTKEGHLRENLKVRGQYRDTLIYGILRHEWGSTG